MVWCALRTNHAENAQSDEWCAEEYTRMRRCAERTALCLTAYREERHRRVVRGRVHADEAVRGAYRTPTRDTFVQYAVCIISIYNKDTRARILIIYRETSLLLAFAVDNRLKLLHEAVVLVGYVGVFVG